MVPFALQLRLKHLSIQHCGTGNTRGPSTFLYTAAKTLVPAFEMLVQVAAYLATVLIAGAQDIDSNSSSLAWFTPSDHPFVNAEATCVHPACQVCATSGWPCYSCSHSSVLDVESLDCVSTAAAAVMFPPATHFTITGDNGINKQARAWTEVLRRDGFICDATAIPTSGGFCLYALL